MHPIIAALSPQEQLTLWEDVNYLNMCEIKAFCEKHSIPYSIWIGTPEGGRRKTKDDDRKGVILNRILQYLTNDKILDATFFPVSVVCFDGLPKKLKPSDRLHYGQYDKENIAIHELLEKLTDGRFRNGAVARIL